ncbi:single-stranded DNA-binding protein, partial [Escherichia coli PA23]
MQRPFRSR